MNILFFMKPKNETAYIYTHNTIRQALEKMKYYNCLALPVIDRAGKFSGTLSSGELQKSGFLNNVSVCRVKDMICGNPKVYVTVYTEIEDLLQMDLTQDFISVVDDRELFIGIVTRSEILKYSCIQKSQPAAITPVAQHSGI